MTDHPDDAIIDDYAAILPTLALKPDLHVHSGESVLPIKNGLPKFKDLPTAFGRSGEVVPEGRIAKGGTKASGAHQSQAELIPNCRLML